MTRQLTLLLFWCLFGTGVVRGAPGTMRSEELKEMIERLRPLHRSRTGLRSQREIERGQLFSEYLEAAHIVPGLRRRKLYILPIGQFSEGQARLLLQTAEYLQHHFSLPIRLQPALDTSSLPSGVLRRHPKTGHAQLDAERVLREVLKANLPADAFGYVAITTQDLSPGRGFDFALGLAATRARVGVWSLFRLEDSVSRGSLFSSTLRRTLKTASHELGHMLSMPHCVAAQCNMNESASIAEVDRRPLFFCPDCLAKICWATGAEPLRLFQGFVEYFETRGLPEEKVRATRLLEALMGPRPERR